MNAIHTTQTANVSVSRLGCARAFAAAVLDGDYAEAIAEAEFAMIHVGLAQHVHYSDSLVKQRGTLGMAFDA